MAVAVPNESLEGLAYFLQRGSAMSFEDARNVLHFETHRRISYYRVWHWAEAIYGQKVEKFPNHSWDRMPRECHIAVTCYTLGVPSVVDDLNAYCRGAQATASSWDMFPYKSLWCFLLRSFQMLPDFPVNSVIRGVQKTGDAPSDKVVSTEFLGARVLSGPPYNYSYYNPGAISHVFHFLPPHLVRDISLYSTREDHREVLLWPFCTFFVFQLSSETFAFHYSSESPPRHLPGMLPEWS